MTIKSNLFRLLTSCSLLGLIAVTGATECFVWNQLGEDIVGENYNDFSGSAVQLSSDGTIVAVGATNNADGGLNAGHVRVYEYIDESWEQIGDDIDGIETFGRLGESIGLSANGRILVVGAPNVGDVRVYQYDSSSASWIQLGEDISGDYYTDLTGSAVALSSDGSSVVIGATNSNVNDPTDYYYEGQVRVYDYDADNDGWVQRGQDILGENYYDGSGKGLAMSSDGSIIAIGAILNSNGSNGYYAGHVRLYEFDGSTWIQLGQDLDGEAECNYSGDTIDLSSDGYTVVIGADNNSNENGAYAGHTRVYTYSEETKLWTQLGQDIDGEAADDESGTSVSISTDGTVIAIGAEWASGRNGDYAGHVRVYEFDSDLDQWIQVGKDVDGDAESTFGHEVSLSSDGTIFAASADSAVYYSGHVKVMQKEACCVNDATFRFRDPADEKTCAWIMYKDGRRANACRFADVQAACPISCGSCCADDYKFTFKRFGKGAKHNGKFGKCFWIKKKAKRKTKYCARNKISRRCPIACDSCLDEIPLIP